MFVKVYAGEEKICTRKLKSAEVAAHCILRKINWGKWHVMLHCHSQLSFAYFILCIVTLTFLLPKLLPNYLHVLITVSVLDILCYIDYIFVIVCHVVEAVLIMPR